MNFISGIILATVILTSAQSFEADPTWTKCTSNPVLGGPELGTCFDVNVIKEGTAKFIMYFSWRPEKAISLSRSDDGIHWSQPEIVLESDDASGWEDDINRSCTVFCYKPSVYYGYDNNRLLLWYNGRNGHNEYVGMVTHEGTLLNAEPSTHEFPDRSLLHSAFAG